MFIFTLSIAVLNKATFIQSTSRSNLGRNKKSLYAVNGSSKRQQIAFKLTTAGNLITWIFDRENNFTFRNTHLHYRVFRSLAYCRETQAALSYRVHMFLTSRYVLLFPHIYFYISKETFCNQFLQFLLVTIVNTALDVVETQLMELLNVGKNGKNMYTEWVKGCGHKNGTVNLCGCK
jgi:hypothetical protein